MQTLLKPFLLAGVATSLLAGCSVDGTVKLDLPMISDTQAEKIDGIFSSFDEKSPGCAVGIIRNSETVFEKGYGLANLDYDQPITPDTVFDIASVSKQFAAMALIMLADEGVVSLDDDVRKYVPEIPDYGTVITLRQLMNHTSGLRDIFMLGTLMGESEKDYFTEDEFLARIARQKAPIFEPGSAFRYSNTGYLLMGIIVGRTTGQTLAEYTKEKIFDPLGMEHTFFGDDATRVVKNRATGYFPNDEGGYKRGVTLLEIIGEGGLLTTVRDLALWDRDFYEGKVWRPEIKAEMLKAGLLSNGETAAFLMETNGVYAGGLVTGKRRGLPIVRHGGTFVGFRTDMLRFPEQKFTVITLCNLGTADPNTLANQVADLFLEDEYTEPAPEVVDYEAFASPEAIPPIDPDFLKEIAGTYYSEELRTNFRFEPDGERVKIFISERRIRLDVADYMSSPIGQLGDDVIGDEVFKFTFERSAGKIVGFNLVLVNGSGFEFSRVD